MFRNGFDSLFSQKAYSFTQPGNRRSRWRPCFESFGEFFRHGAFQGEHSVSSFDKRGNGGSARKRENPRSLNSAKSFMSRRTKGIYSDFFHVNWNMSRRLSGIYRKENAMFVTQFSDFAQRQCGGTDIGGVCTDQEPRVWSYPYRNCFADVFCCSSREKTKGWKGVIFDNSLLCQPINGTKNRVVFQITDQNVVSTLQNSLNQEIQRISGVKREDDIPRVRNAEQG